MSAKTETLETKKEQPWYTGHRQRMDKKLVAKGVESLTEEELLEALLMRAIPRKDVKPIVKDLLKEFKTIQGVLYAPKALLMKISGIKDKTANFFEIIRCVAQTVALGRMEEKPLLSNWERLLDYVTALYVGEKIEILYVFYLDSKSRLIQSQKEKIGEASHVAVSPREILKEALNLNASQVILVHNHPSGEVEASADDIKTTMAIATILKPTGIRLAEHLIVGQNRKVSSMRAQGILTD